MGRMAARRLVRIRVAPAVAGTLALLLVLAGILGTAGRGRAALEKPVYTEGDRWVYVLAGSLEGLPGLNASASGLFRLGFNGIVEVDVLGAAASPGDVQAETQSSGFLNGTLEVPGNLTIDVTGTFSSDVMETWEGTDYLPVASDSAMAYVVNVNLGFSTSVTTNLWVNETTTYGALPAFALDVGGSASATYTSGASVATSFSLAGRSYHLENSTTLTGTWSRQVLDLEDVHVEAGTFSAYRLNESLGSFPGLGFVGAAGGANETAWFSNETGSYVKRVAYVNGTKVAEMRLKSYVYPAAPVGLSVVDLILLFAIPFAAAALLIAFVLRRRKARAAGAKGSSGVGPVGELPPKEPGGKP